MARRNKNWLLALAEAVEDTESPRTFWLWSGIFTLGAALQRRVWVPYGMDNIYPNIFLMTIASPGKCRKAAPIKFAKKLLKLVQIPVFVDSPTKRALTMELDRISKDPNNYFEVHGSPTKKVQAPLALISEELSSFLAVDPKGMIEALTDLYDSPDFWAYKTKGEGEDAITNACICCYFASTPAWIADNLPEGAIGGGFTSRYVIIPGTEKYKRVTFPKPPTSQQLQDLLFDLNQVCKICGEFQWDPEARSVFDEWYQGLDKLYSQIRDERLHPFIERMHAIAIKTGMILHVAERDDLILSAEDITQGITLVQDVLKNAGPALGAHGRSIYGSLTEAVIRQIKTTKEITFSELMRINFHNATKKELTDVISAIETMGLISYANEGPKTVLRWKGHKGVKENG